VNISVHICFTLATRCAYALCIHMCICICICIYICVCMYICIYVCISIRIYAYVYGCVYVCMCMYIYIHIYTNSLSGQSCNLHPTPATKLYSILGYDHWGGTFPLHHPYTLACTLSGARQHQPFSSFTLLPSTPIFDKTSHPSPHTLNSFTFKRVQISTHSITFKSSDSNY